MNRWTITGLLIYLVTSVGLTGLSTRLDARLPTATGFTQSFYQDSAGTLPLVRHTAREISLDFLDEQPNLPRQFFSTTWDGLWYLSEAGAVDFYVGADDRAVLHIDGNLVLERSAGMRTTARQMSLEAGFHEVSVAYEQYGGGYHLYVGWAPAGQDARPLDPDRLFPVRPTDEDLALHERARTLRRVLPIVWFAPPVLLIVGIVVPLLPPKRRWHILGFSLLVGVWGYVGWPHYTHHLPPNLLAVGLAALYFVLPNAVRTRRAWRVLYWAACGLVLVALDAYIGVPGGMADFRKAQYRAGAFLLSNPEYAYDDVCGSYAYLPFSGLLFVPFGVFPREIAYLLYTMVGRLTVLAATYWLVAYSRARDWKLWLLLFLIAFNGPLDRILWLGNSTHFILLLLLGAVYSLQAKKPILAGILFGLAPLLKLSMLLLGVYFVLRRNWRVCFAWGTTLATCILLSLIMFGYDLHVRWIDTCILQFQGGAIPAFRAQSIDGFLAKHWLADTNVNDWTAVPVDATFRFLHHVGVLLVMLPAALAALSTWRRTEPGTTHVEVSLFICAAILISPISWSHYFLFLLLPIAFYAGDRFPIRARSPLLGRVLSSAFVLAVVLFSLPEEVSVTYYRAQESGLSRWLLSHYFFGGVLFYLFLLGERFTGTPTSNSSPANREG